MKPSLFYLLALLKTAAYFAVNRGYELHRDELLYLALGKHPDWGFWSNPPLIGWLAALIRLFPSDAPEMVRLLPLLASLGTLWLALRITRALGGGFYAELLCGITLLLCPPYLRTMVMYQPVVFDIFFWTLCIYLLIYWLQNKEQRWWYWMGAAFGMGLLNKYLLFLWAAALLPALLLDKNTRPEFRKRYLYVGAGLALLIWSPNLIWQIAHHFPVFQHLAELNRQQLDHVDPAGFLAGQLLAHLPAIIPVLLGWYFLFSKNARAYRVLGWTFLLVEALMLVLHAKDYYIFGIYPALLAAGAVQAERISPSKYWRWSMVVLLGFLGMRLLPFSLPLLSPAAMRDFSARFVEKTGIDGPLKWEDGQMHALPQDYADMLGWKDIAQTTLKAWNQIERKEEALVYAENYGQAAAIDWYARGRGLPQVASFSDTYALWLPDSLGHEVSSFIYVNDELGKDVQELFGECREIGGVQNPLSREFGTKVYLCTQPKRSFSAFYGERVREVLSQKVN